jgi:hypothetical protein
MTKNISPELDKNSRDRETKLDRREIRKITSVQTNQRQGNQGSKQGKTQSARNKPKE